MNSISSFFLGAFVLGAGSTASAQNYSISWSTIDGGGGASASGVFSLNGSIGQPDAGVMTAGAYTVSGGFWSFDDVIAPRLFIARNGGNAIISWAPATPGFVLQASTNSPTGSWSDAPTGNTNPAALPFQFGARFYRLRR